MERSAAGPTAPVKNMQLAFNLISIYYALLLIYKMFIQPIFETDDSDENVENMADGLIFYTIVCTIGIVISNIFAIMI